MKPVHSCTNHSVIEPYIAPVSLEKKNCWKLREPAQFLKYLNTSILELTENTRIGHTLLVARYFRIRLIKPDIGILVDRVGSEHRGII